MSTVLLTAPGHGRLTVASTRACLGLAARPLLDEIARAGRLDERFDSSQIFAAWRALHAAGDVDHPRSSPRGPFRNILGSQSAGENQSGQGGNRVQNIVRNDRPVPPICPGTERQSEPHRATARDQRLGRDTR